VLEGLEISYFLQFDSTLIAIDRAGLRKTTGIHWIGAFLSDILKEHIRCRTATVLAVFDTSLLLSFLCEV
jgi:hypothetical protein